jgi:hypothetical protein
VLDQGSALHNCLAGRPLGLRGVEVPLKAESSMTWSRAFPEPFVLADGRKIKTVYEAGQLVLALPGRHRANGHWQGAMERLMAAAEDDLGDRSCPLGLVSVCDSAGAYVIAGSRDQGLRFLNGGDPLVIVGCPLAPPHAKARDAVERGHSASTLACNFDDADGDKLSDRARCPSLGNVGNS